MKYKLNIALFSIGIMLFNTLPAQEIALFNQLNGRLDYTAIGNTLNTSENNSAVDCVINTASSASLNLSSSQTIEAAYLYWAGSGSGDFTVTLNTTEITPSRTFSFTLDASREFFAAFADVTTLIQTEGNGLYTLSNLEQIDISSAYCSTGTNFAGWAITIIYSDPALPLNQLNVYDGLESVPENITIELNNLNVMDTNGARIGFVAWEGDAGLAVDEVLQMNGITLSNPPLNPANNAFNGTNSFTNDSNLYNMDIDVYPIQNTINIGDTSAIIQLTSGQDLVMVNNIITVLNSQLPDATVAIESVYQRCNSRELTLEYTIKNLNSTQVLPANTPVAFYADANLVAQAQTNNDIPINGSEFNEISFTIASTNSNIITLSVVVDDSGTGVGIITEINETNNSDITAVEFLESPEITPLSPLFGCNFGTNEAVFNLQNAFNEIGPSFDLETAIFYESLEDLINNIGALINPTQYINANSTETIYFRLDANPCYEIFAVNLEVTDCEPIIPQGFSPNGDGYNDWFKIQGLYDVFLQHELLIFNRLGALIFKGDNNLKWDGKANYGPLKGDNLLPVGTYFYVLYLNVPNTKPISGWVYMNY
ncbi:MAG: gliding motility-associated C-terminal domain-containing protein [Flavobacteriaceae bacterium]|jgi:gliding motility-associated-like protein|nr:gliding motility-associated C-terminal domain-containing protein [Flavobacteriaceae bacterium]MDG2498968.1 gliding motility-associated C-terminal domain-containing protein [Flavobacteriaceae bacterium]